MDRLADLWTEFRAGKPLKSVSAGVPYIRFSKDDPYYGGDCFYDEFGGYETYFGIEFSWMDADDWELAPERVADYDVGNGKIETYVVGKQPGNFESIKGSFRDAPAPRVADYLVLQPTRWSKYQKDGIVFYKDTWFKETHPIGQQPEGSVLVPGSEKTIDE